MKDFITDLLNLKDEQNLDVRMISSAPDKIVLQMEYFTSLKVCPHCQWRMHSKGIYQRTVTHPSISKTYFPKALPVVDSFHVIKLINHKLNLYLNKLRKKYRYRDLRLL